MAATMKNAVFWDMTPCGSCGNQILGGMYRFHYQGEKNQRARKNFEVCRLLGCYTCGSCKN
jgi:hypothetical protein